MPYDLDKYAKNKGKDKSERRQVTSIHITQRQLDFIKKRGLNLSELVRDFLENLMRENKEK